MSQQKYAIAIPYVRVLPVVQHGIESISVKENALNGRKATNMAASVTVSVAKKQMFFTQENPGSIFPTVTPIDIFREEAGKYAISQSLARPDGLLELSK